MGAYIITNSELIDIANAIRQKLSSDDSFTLEDMPTAITNIGKITGSGATIVEGNDIKYLIDEDKIKAIADAVREKNGSSDTYSLSELPQAILDIVTATYTINYYNGSTLLYSETVSSGGNGSYSGSTPTKTSDAQYSYTFVGWSNGTDDNTVDNDALSDIDGDRNIYACFTETLRTYTVKFVRASADGGRTLQTLNNVAYGTVLTNNSYTGSTPTTIQGSGQDYAFLGWTPSFTAITGNTTYTAQFDSPIKEITDTWDQIITKIDNGTYKTAYKVGNYKPLDLGTTYGTVNMQIVAIDVDELANGTGVAPLTFLSKELLLQKSRMTTDGKNTNGYPATTVMKPLLDNTIYPLISSNIKERIQRVNKTYYDSTTQSTLTSVEKLWIPSAREMFGGTSYESSGAIYTTIFKNNTTRIKNINGSAYNWWLRSAYYDSISRFYDVKPDGSIHYSGADWIFGVCLGFCLGAEVETITDDWATILANTNPSASYSIGDTKSITINNELHLM